jgi:hypothetical protein
MNLQRSDMSSAQIQQALQQGNLGLGTGMLQAGYMPQNQALEMLRLSQVPAQFASAGRLQGADLQAQLGGRGIESLMQGSQLANELRQQQLAASLQSVLGAQNPTTGSFGGGVVGSILDAFGLGGGSTSSSQSGLSGGINNLGSILGGLSGSPTGGPMDDDDGDGTINMFDSFPNDPNKT